MHEWSHERKRKFKDAAYGGVAEFGDALAHPLRLEILDLLAQRERDLLDISRELGLAPSTIEQELRALEGVGVVERVSAREADRYRVASEAMVGALVALRAAWITTPSGREVMTKHVGQRDRPETEDRGSVARRIERGELVLLDVRPKEEYEAGHIPGAIAAPLDQLASISRALPANAEVVAYCRGPFCTWSDAAVARLREEGINARLMAEGVHEWRRQERYVQ